MGSDQIAKMKKHAPIQYIVLSWILTQDIAQVTTCYSSIKDLGDEENNELTYILYPHITKMEYPNIILTDNVKDKIAAILSLIINWTIQLGNL